MFHHRTLLHCSEPHIHSSIFLRHFLSFFLRGEPATWRKTRDPGPRIPSTCPDASVAALPAPSVPRPLARARPGPGGESGGFSSVRAGWGCLRYRSYLETNPLILVLFSAETWGGSTDKALDVLYGAMVFVVAVLVAFLWPPFFHSGIISPLFLERIFSRLWISWLL